QVRHYMEELKKRQFNKPSEDRIKKAKELGHEMDSIILDFIRLLEKSESREEADEIFTAMNKVIVIGDFLSDKVWDAIDWEKVKWAKEKKIKEVV
ncbi:MAG: hypothetical protein ACE5J3_09315, partial [Methanosarcinales archaeon]